MRELLAREFDPADDEPVSVVVARLAAIESNRPIGSLDPLGRYVDCDELNALFGPAFLENAAVTARVEFSYEGYHVRASTDGTVRLLERDG